MFASTSALCFDGDFISPDRFIDIATSTHTTNKPYSLVHLRNKWVVELFLKNNTIKSGLSSSQQQQDIFHWADTFSPTNDDLQQFFHLFNNHNDLPHY
jgi:hypothetical protein